MLDFIRWFLIYYCAYFNCGCNQHDAALAAIIDVASGIRG